MDDQLKAVIASGRDQLDNAIPDQEVFEIILKKLKYRKRKKRVVRILSISSLSGIAAVLLIGFFTAVFEKRKEGQPKVAGINNIMRESVTPLAIVDTSRAFDLGIAKLENLNLSARKTATALRKLKQGFAFQISASPAKRLTSIYAIEKQHKVDKVVADALFKVLNNDPNANVRMAALDVLSSKMSDAEIRKRLVYAMVEQDEPMVQLMMIQMFTGTGEKDFIEQLRQIIHDPKTNEEVREEARFSFAQHTSSLN